mmetsp:Transcript_717/g.1663  ORF Transcript_717/g.1663 Transcript_717/m.1663 type:complete len:235 (+) Transcript_717:880-1584(+)
MLWAGVGVARKVSHPFWSVPTRARFTARCGRVHDVPPLNFPSSVAARRAGSIRPSDPLAQVTVHLTRMLVASFPSRKLLVAVHQERFVHLTGRGIQELSRLVAEAPPTASCAGGVLLPSTVGADPRLLQLKSRLPCFLEFLVLAILHGDLKLVLAAGRRLLRVFDHDREVLENILGGVFPFFLILCPEFLHLFRIQLDDGFLLGTIGHEPHPGNNTSRDDVVGFGRFAIQVLVA